jgi:hypothetical protein
MRSAVVAREAPCKVGHLALLAHSTQYLLYTPKRPLLPGGVRHRFEVIKCRVREGAKVGRCGIQVFGPGL